MQPDNKNKQFNDPEDWHNFTKYLCETNRFILSDYWDNFIKTIVETSEKRAKILKKGVTLVRARIGTEWVTFDDGGEQPCPISPHDMGPPPKNIAKEGRLNSKGIPYLYLSTNEETAISEVRPWIGSEITLGYFKILEDLKIVDTSIDESKFYSKYEIDLDSEEMRPISYSSTEKEKYIWGYINSAFSRPMSPSESKFKYLPTQYLSEKFKTIGYDGIAYKSSLSEKGHNICLFYPDKAKCHYCNMFAINKIKYKYEQSGNPVRLSEDNRVLHTIITDIRPVDK
jgi:hypothetical protein